MKEKERREIRTTKHASRQKINKRHRRKERVAQEAKKETKTRKKVALLLWPVTLVVIIKKGVARLIKRNKNGAGKRKRGETSVYNKERKRQASIVHREHARDDGKETKKKTLQLAQWEAVCLRQLHLHLVLQGDHEFILKHLQRGVLRHHNHRATGLCAGQMVDALVVLRHRDGAN